MQRRFQTKEKRKIRHTPNREFCYVYYNYDRYTYTITENFSFFPLLSFILLSNKRKEKEIMDIRKSKVACILLLNMLDAELSRVNDYALEDDNENTNHALVTSLIQVLDDVDEAIELLHNDVV